MYIVQRMTLLKTTKQIHLWIRLYLFESRFKNDFKHHIINDIIQKKNQMINTKIKED